jgi:hypothetical protein
MIISELAAIITGIEQDRTLHEETAFARRAEVLDDLEFLVLDTIAHKLQRGDAQTELHVLQQRALHMQQQLAAIDDRIFSQLQAAIRAGTCRGAALRARLTQIAGYSEQARVGYDALDRVVHRLLHVDQELAEAELPEAEMIAYQPTPARVVFQLAELLTPQDTFVDIGAGLGHVPILVNLLRGIPSTGIELLKPHCGYARACAASLKLDTVSIVQSDARRADYMQGTAFFLYTPFIGSILVTALAKLQASTHGRAIRLFSYGPCTRMIAQHGWPKRLHQHDDDGGILGIFTT